MKKIFATALGIAAAFAIAAPAFAQVNIGSACPPGQFNVICSADPSQLGVIIGRVITILLIAAVLIALFFLIWGGIRWILSGGDKAKVEAAQKTIVSAIIGLVIAFLAYFILQLVLGLFHISLSNLTPGCLLGC